MPMLDLTADELVATLCRSRLPTVVVEGKDDIRIYRWVEARFGDEKANVLSAGGRNNLLAVYQRRNEYAHLPVAFVADRDMWLFSGIPPGFHNIIWTQGYSIENDLYAGAELETMLEADEAKEHQQVLHSIIEWFAFEVEEFLAGKTPMVDRGCDGIVPPGKIEIDEQVRKHRRFRAPNDELHQQIREAYQLQLRGKLLFDLLIRFLNARDRDTKYNTFALYEIAFKMTPSHRFMYQLISEIEGQLRNEIPPN